MLLRYVIKFAIVIPAVIFALMPVRENLRANLSLGKELFCIFNAIMLCAFSNFLAIFSTAELELDNNFWYEKNLLTLESGIVRLIIALVLGIIFFRTLHDKIPMLMRQKHIDKIWNFLCVIPMFMTFFIWWATPLHPKVMLTGRVRPIALCVACVFLAMIFILYQVFWWTAEKLIDAANLQQENTLLSIEGKRYRELRKYMDETRALRHDFRQHIRVITQLSSSGNFNELRKYLQQFSESSEKNYAGYCENISVDAIAAYYASFAEKHGTKIIWQLNLPGELPLRESEYCAMLGNLLENALRAVKNLPEHDRHVKVISSLLSEYIIGLSIDNVFYGEIESVKPGIGLTSVMNTVKRFDGSMSIKCENNIFSVDIILHCNAQIA